MHAAERLVPRLVDALGLGLLGIIVAAFGVQAVRAADSQSNRTRCASNLRHIAIAAISYMDDQSGRTKYMPHVRALREHDAPEDSVRAFEMLVQFGYIDDCSVFVCPSAGDEPRSLTERERENLRLFGGFEPHDLSSSQLSYGWTREARNMSTPSSEPIAADKAVWTRGGRGNHVGGRNVVMFGGHTEWVPVSDVDYQRRIADEVNLISQDLEALAASARDDEAAAEAERETAREAEGGTLSEPAAERGGARSWSRSLGRHRKTAIAASIGAGVGVLLLLVARIARAALGGGRPAAGGDAAR